MTSSIEGDGAINFTKYQAVAISDADGKQRYAWQKFRSVEKPGYRDGDPPARDPDYAGQIVAVQAFREALKV